MIHSQNAKLLIINLSTIMMKIIAAKLELDVQNSIKVAIFVNQVGLKLMQAADQIVL